MSKKKSLESCTYLKPNLTFIFIPGHRHHCTVSLIFTTSFHRVYVMHSRLTHHHSAAPFHCVISLSLLLNVSLSTVPLAATSKRTRVSHHATLIHHRTTCAVHPVQLRKHVIGTLHPQCSLAWSMLYSRMLRSLIRFVASALCLMLFNLLVLSIHGLRNLFLVIMIL
ncbi:hypothetical protein RND81_01G090900 [Saponaria officinalis]|uniref:Uncharacterized protein n=1 Tax=Saponaria officinalis TaxID=3572 RepID=A0AAW1N993_SAPOF